MKKRKKARARARSKSKYGRHKPLLIINPTRVPELNDLIMQAVPGLVAAIIEAHHKLGNVTVTRIASSYQRPSDDGTYLQTVLTGESAFYIRRHHGDLPLLVEGSCETH